MLFSSQTWHVGADGGDVFSQLHLCVESIKCSSALPQAQWPVSSVSIAAAMSWSHRGFDHWYDGSASEAPTIDTRSVVQDSVVVLTIVAVVVLTIVVASYTCCCSY